MRMPVAPRAAFGRPFRGERPGMEMKTAVNRLRGVERDIVQAPVAGETAPYYEPQGNEVAIFEAAYRKRLPVMLKGPTG